MRSRVAAVVKNDIYAKTIEALPEGLHGSRLVFEGYKTYSDRNDTSSAGSRGTNGAIFEYLILESLLSAGISPIFHQARIPNVLDTVYDIFLFHSKTPAVISCKTSFRERYKQALYEGVRFKNVYPSGFSVLMTMNHAEGARAQRQIAEHESIGADRAVVIEEGNLDFDHVIDQLKRMSFVNAERIMSVTGTMLN